MKTYFSKRLFHYLETRTILLSHPIKIDTAEFNYFLFFFFCLVVPFFLLLRFAYHGLVWVTIFEFWRWLSLDGCKFFSSTSVLFVCLFVCFSCFFSLYHVSVFTFSLFKTKREKKRRLMKKAIFWCQKNLALPGGGWWKIDIHGHESKRLCVCVNCLLCWFFVLFCCCRCCFVEAYTVDGKKRISCVVFFCFVLFYTRFKISACSMITSGSCWTFSMRAYN